MLVSALYNVCYAQLSISLTPSILARLSRDPPSFGSNSCTPDSADLLRVLWNHSTPLLRYRYMSLAAIYTFCRCCPRQIGHVRAWHPCPTCPASLRELSKFTWPRRQQQAVQAKARPSRPQSQSWAASSRPFHLHLHETCRRVRRARRYGTFGAGWK